MLGLVSPGSDVVGILEALGAYRSARVAFLAALECPISNRDPFAEFAERLVAAWLGGSLATSRVQHTYDLLDTEGRTVQVRYLANPAGSWVNGHQISFVPGLDRYALVVIEAFELSGALCVDVGSVEAICARLGKRHPKQDTSLQLGQANWRQLVAERSDFKALGVSLFLPGDIVA
jgi:hypothetical protein